MGRCATCGEEYISTGIWRTLKERKHLEGLSTDGRILLKRISQKKDKERRLASSGSGEGQMVGSRGCGNEPPAYTRSRKFLELLRDYQSLGKGFPSLSPFP